jgi:hypothetical protein
MLEIQNRTSFEAAVVPSQNKEGYDYAVITVKGTFEIGKNAKDLPIAEAQAPIVWSDEHYGEPGQSSVKYESDIFPSKKGTDVILLGHAYASKKSDKWVDVGLQIGTLSKNVRVFGNRYWHRSVVSWGWSEPAPFERIPLMYEKAFGGMDTSDPNPGKHGYEKRNPVGTGFNLSGIKERLEGLPFPNLEDPQELICSWKDRPSPAGFGFIGRNWEPRVNYAGTYDESWQKKRCPLLPEDFDERYYNGASPGLIGNPSLKAGAAVQITNAFKTGVLAFNLPKRSIDATVWIKGKETVHTLTMDTVIIEPDEMRILLVWRATVPCFRQFLYIDRVRIKEVAF